MENITGLLKIQVKRGIDLAVRDILSSDPYVVVSMAHQKWKTRVVKNSCNPEWKDEQTLSITDPNIPINLAVYDKDMFTADDKMGEAKIDIKPYMDVIERRLENLPTPTTIARIQPSRDNCLADESSIVWRDGKIYQDMVLGLRNVECGKVEVQLEWIHVLDSSRRL
ncbi:protein C2-DOMAIN ABA-RELATED 7-like [Syzygium oleosum]|uniref:protein C2-DOMAIN ABA-RELATED 7-like n=1 Tax=Syzygium oleosum TaxID=219896 RepID=UPI0011D217D3|nr:protein C2-DOMAIN ABA-RELATED 7-like [Syzygium oleosum]